MKIKIKEQQLLPIYEAYSDTFSFDVLSSLGGSGDIEEDNLNRYNYCVKHLGSHFAEGTSRVVFQLSDNCVLKLAKNTLNIMPGTGEEQNKREYEIYQKLNTDIVPKIFYCDKNYYYIVCECVIPAEKVDFEKYLGIPFNSYWTQNSEKIENKKKNGDEEIGFNKYFNNIKNVEEEYSGKTITDILYYIDSNYIDDAPYYDEEIEEIIRKSEWLTKLVDFVEATGTTDIDIENFGIVNRDGKPMIVLLDYGLDLDTWEEYYT